MLNSDQRGYMEGSKVGVSLRYIPTCSDVIALAEETLMCLKSKDYAHLEPEDMFLSGFVQGLLFMLLQNTNALDRKYK